LNIEKYTERARGFIQSAQQTALGRGHQQFAPVHLLKVLMDDDQGLASGLIDRSGGDSKAVRAGIEAALKKIPVISGDNSQVYLSREMARVFETAESAAQKAGDSFVTVERLLLALVIEKDTDAGKILSSAGVTANALNQAIETIRKGRTADSASAESQYDALK
jgi:ATP-dependent Clp protease ATP-binding subunit ClpB